MPKPTPFTNALESKINLNYHDFVSFNQFGLCFQGLCRQINLSKVIILPKILRLGVLDTELWGLCPLDEKCT